jgi:hypothetical protein
MGEVSDKDDSQLQVAGVPVNRTEFNVIFMEITRSLKQVQGRTGVKHEIPDVGKMVKLISEEPVPSLSNYTDIYIGWYLSTQKVCIQHHSPLLSPFTPSNRLPSGVSVTRPTLRRQDR